MPATHAIKLINADIVGEIKLDFNNLKKTVLVLRSVDHKLRQQIIKMLKESEKLTVSEIYLKLRIEQSIASQHLAILRRSGIVNTKRNGKFIYYALNNERLAEISELIKELSK